MRSNESNSQAAEVSNSPTTMTRKSFLRLTAGVALAASVGGLTTGCGARGRNLKFSSLDQVLAELQLLEANAPVALQQPWSLYKVLNHAAQSMEYSMTGYPLLDPPARQKIARLVFNYFRKQGFMSHDLGAPVPGAPDIPSDGPLEEGYLRLRNAISDFRNFTGALFPHFSYGQLTREEWEIAHSMHCADHFSSMTYTVTPA